MTKNIMLAASMTMLLVAIPGQAFARAAATTEPHRHEVIAPSGRQAADTFNAFDATITTLPAAPMTHRYEGGPKTND
jgi:hypothetical protein